MAKKMLIDATHHEEMRMAILHGKRLEGFEVETSSKKQLKGSIYLAKVMRIEPSLQAAFVEYGGNRQGFLPFSEIHPDYYHIPVDDQERLNDAEDLSENKADWEAQEGDTALEEDHSELSEGDVETLSDAPEDILEVLPKKRPRYKIQEVIRRRQVLLIQITKEERGGKGAALTTYLSLPGRYCVFMPNSGDRRGGVSRKITDNGDRKRLRNVLDSLHIPDGMSLIVRTAGSQRNKMELKKDFEYLLRLWSDIRAKTLASIAPSLIYEEGDLIKRALRDTYTKDIEQVLVDGEEGYKAAKLFMKTMAPSHAKKIQRHKNKDTSLFHEYFIEDLIDDIFQPKVTLPSGGSIVLAQTEALVAIDVNSGKSTKERNLAETALKTNLEAAKEAARQLRLRDLSGLVVVDFIDMYDKGHIQQVERAFKEALSFDRARIQLGKISQFGLLEMSRQRLRPSIMESNTRTCTHCQGTGIVRSVDSMALFILRQIEGASVNNPNSDIAVKTPMHVDLYLLNKKRRILSQLEMQYDVTITITADPDMLHTEHDLHITKLQGQSNAESLRDTSQTELSSNRGVSSPKEPVNAEYEKSRAGHQNRGEKKHRHFGQARHKTPHTSSLPSENEQAQAPTSLHEIGTQKSDAAQRPDLSKTEGTGTNSEQETSSKRRRRRRRGDKKTQNLAASFEEGAMQQDQGASLPQNQENLNDLKAQEEKLNNVTDVDSQDAERAFTSAQHTTHKTSSKAVDPRVHTQKRAKSAQKKPQDKASRRAHMRDANANEQRVQDLGSEHLDALTLRADNAPEISFAAQNDQKSSEKENVTLLPIEDATLEQKEHPKRLALPHTSRRKPKSEKPEVQDLGEKTQRQEAPAEKHAVENDNFNYEETVQAKSSTKAQEDSAKNTRVSRSPDKRKDKPMSEALHSPKDADLDQEKPKRKVRAKKPKSALEEKSASKDT